MPGAPNRPPEADKPAPAAPLLADEASRRLNRRLGPMRVALRLDLWKGAPSPELVVPLELAEACLAAGDLPTASGHLDQLAVRFAEPRWPTLPEPFKGLRVSIPAPQPPQWDPEHALPADEKEARRLRRDAELQLALARASVAWGAAHQIDLSDLLPRIERAAPAIGTTVDASFWTEMDGIWLEVRARVPMPQAAGRKPAATSAATPA